MKDKPADVINDTIALKEKFKNFHDNIANDRQNQQIAIDVAEIVLNIFESRHPKDVRPRLAIKAAKDFLDEIISIEELRNYRNAAHTASVNSAFISSRAKEAGRITDYTLEKAACSAAYACECSAAYAGMNVADLPPGTAYAVSYPQGNTAAANGAIKAAHSSACNAAEEEDYIEGNNHYKNLLLDYFNNLKV